MIEGNELVRVVQHALGAAHKAVYEDYPESEFAVLVVALPIAREMLADAEPATQLKLREMIEAALIESLPHVEWPFEKRATA